MNDNWWTMQKMIEGREHELRMRMEQIKPWIRSRVGGRARPIRKVIGRALMALGKLLVTDTEASEIR